MTVSFTFPALGFWKRKFQVKTFVKNDCRIERHPFLALETLDQSGGTGREKLFEMLVRQFLVQKMAEHQQSASFTVAFREFGPVSYTHLTLPTDYSVWISGVPVSLKKKTPPQS